MSRAGLVLCGGQSQRMGQPKAWLEFGPERLLQRVVRQLESVVDQVVVVAAAGQDLPVLPNSVRIISDSKALQGPLRGLSTGLGDLPKSVDLVFAAATDMPLIHPAWWERIADLLGNHDLAIPEVGGRFHPLAAVYRREPTLITAERLLARNQLRLGALLASTRYRVIEPHELVDIDPQMETLRNLNTAEDYQQALRVAGYA